MNTLLLTIALLLAIALSPAYGQNKAPFYPLFKVFCQGQPLFRGRVDPLVEPGVVGNHAHRICGANGFGPFTKDDTYLSIYKKLFSSPCTTGSIQKVDNSVYWHPDLYYRWPNGSYSVVDTGGLTVYYLFRAGSGNQSAPAYKAFPPGFRMTGGELARRSYNGSLISNRAVSYACLAAEGNPETPYLPTDTKFCKNGLRLQLHFPQCWDGVNLDSPNHRDHMSYPIEAPDNGNCPPTHPVRMPNLFFEAFYSVDKYPHGEGIQPFVLATGDPTGYGYHGDFISGWDPVVMQAAIEDPSCGDKNTNEGNTVENCKPLAPYVHRPGPGECQLQTKIPLTEDLGAGHTIARLPGCNPITPGPQNAVPCYGAPSASYDPGLEVRFHLRSKKTMKFLSCPELHTMPLTANATILTLTEVFTVAQAAGGVGLAEELSLQYWSPNGPSNGNILCNRGGISKDETFKIIPQTGNFVAIQALKNNMYLSVQGDTTIAPTSGTVGDNELFERVTPTGGNIF